MKRGLAAIAGLLLGLAAGFALVLANPLVQVGALEPPADGVGIVTRYTMPEVAGLQIGLGPLLGLAEADDAAVADPAAQGIRIGIAVLPGPGDGTAALAVKVSLLSPQNSLWRARLGTLDYWSIAWPGEGSAFATGYSNFWALCRDLVVALISGRGRAGLAPAYAVSALPPATDDAGLFGSSGRYAGLRGSIHEILEPRTDGPPAWVLTLLPEGPEITPR
jgi:hypothetical protein